MGFSAVAVEVMRERMKGYKNRVGSLLKQEYPSLYKDYEATDCITFVLNVLQEAFKKQGKDQISKDLISYGMAKRGNDVKPQFYGDLLAKKLIEKHQWQGIYLTPDRYHPTDGENEHPYVSRIAINKCSYYKVPVQYLAINYKPTPKTHDQFQALTSHKARALDKIALSGLEKIQFGFGISRGGLHTWLFSKGKVYEVHWEEVGAKLYDATHITDFKWLSSLIAVPPDASTSLKLIKCG